MGASDTCKKGREGSALNEKRAMEGRKAEEQEVQAESTLEIGNFVGELATALRFVEKTGLDEGDWLEEPERLYSDGLCFGEEIKSATQDKLQITLTLDTSTSMWLQNCMESAAPTFRALDRMLRLAQEELPPGTLTYQPFIFHEAAFQIPASFVGQFTQNSFDIKRRFTQRDGSIKTYNSKSFFLPHKEVTRDRFRQAVQAGEIPNVPHDLDQTDHDGSAFFQAYVAWNKKHKMCAEDTLLHPLFQAIQDWEAAQDHNATRLDLVITDGHFEDEDDVRKASGVQEQRNGKLTTVFLNFLHPLKWARVHLPDRCFQVPVSKNNIDCSVRNAILETISSLTL